MDESDRRFGRKIGFLVAAVGGLFLLANHASAVSLREVYFVPAVFGTAFVVYGGAMAAFPQVFCAPVRHGEPPRDAIRRTPWHRNVAQAVLAVVGMAAGLWLWFGVYMR